MDGEIASLVIFISTGALWIVMALQCNYLHIRFLRKCPNEARHYDTLR